MESSGAGSSSKSGRPDSSGGFGPDETYVLIYALNQYDSRSFDLDGKYLELSSIAQRLLHPDIGLLPQPDHPRRVLVTKEEDEAIEMGGVFMQVINTEFSINDRGLIVTNVGPSTRSAIQVLARNKPILRAGAPAPGRRAVFTMSGSDIEKGQCILGLSGPIPTPVTPGPRQGELFAVSRHRTTGFAGHVPPPPRSQEDLLVGSQVGIQWSEQGSHRTMICKVLDQLVALRLGKKMQEQGVSMWDERGMKRHPTYFWETLNHAIRSMALKMADSSEFAIPIPYPAAGELKKLFPDVQCSGESPNFFYAMLSQGLNRLHVVLKSLLQNRLVPQQYQLEAMWTPLAKVMGAAVRGLLRDVFTASRLHYLQVRMHRWRLSPVDGAVNQIQENNIQNDCSQFLWNYLQQKMRFLAGACIEQLLRSGNLQAGDNDVWGPEPQGLVHSDVIFVDPIFWAAIGTSDISDAGLPNGLLCKSTERHRKWETLLLHLCRTQDGADATEAVTEIFHRSLYGFFSAGFLDIAVSFENSGFRRMAGLMHIHPNQDGVFASNSRDFAPHVDGTRTQTDSQGNYSASLKNLMCPDFRHAADADELFNWLPSEPSRLASRRGLSYYAGYSEGWEPLPMTGDRLINIQDGITREDRGGAITEECTSPLVKLSASLRRFLSGWSVHGDAWSLFPYSSYEPHEFVQEFHTTREHAVQYSAGTGNPPRDNAPHYRANLFPPLVMYDAPNLILQWARLNIRMEPKLLVEQIIGLQQISLILGNLARIPFDLAVNCDLVYWASAATTEINPEDECVEPLTRRENQVLQALAGSDEFVKHLLKATPPVPKQALEAVIHTEQDVFVAAEGAATVPFLEKAIEETMCHWWQESDEPLEMRKSITECVLKGGGRTIYELGIQLSERIDIAMNLMLEEGKVRQANMTAEQATRALNNYVELIRKAVLCVTSLLTSALSLLMLTDLLLFGPSVYSDGDTVVPHMTSELAAAFLSNRWLADTGWNYPLYLYEKTKWTAHDYRQGIDKLNRDDTEAVGLMKRIVKAAIENTVFYFASFPEMTKGSSAEVEMVEIVATPSLFGFAREQIRVKTQQDWCGMQEAPRLFIIQALMIPAQNAIRHSSTLPLIVNEYVAQCFDTHQWQQVYASADEVQWQRMTGRTMGRLISGRAEGRTEEQEKLRVFMDAVLNQPHNQYHTFSQDPILGFFHEVATSEQYCSHGEQMHVIIPSVFPSLPNDQALEEQTDYTRWRQLQQELKRHAIPISATHALCLEARAPHPRTSETGIVVSKVVWAEHVILNHVHGRRQFAAFLGEEESTAVTSSFYVTYSIPAMAHSVTQANQEMAQKDFEQFDSEGSMFSEAGRCNTVNNHFECSIARGCNTVYTQFRAGRARLPPEFLRTPPIFARDDSQASEQQVTQWDVHTGSTEHHESRSHGNFHNGHRSGTGPSSTIRSPITSDAHVVLSPTLFAVDKPATLIGHSVLIPEERSRYFPVALALAKLTIPLSMSFNGFGARGWILCRTTLFELVLAIQQEVRYMGDDLVLEHHGMGCPVSLLHRMQVQIQTDYWLQRHESRTLNRKLLENLSWLTASEFSILDLVRTNRAAFTELCSLFHVFVDGQCPTGNQAVTMPPRNYRNGIVIQPIDSVSASADAQDDDYIKVFRNARAMQTDGSVDIWQQHLTWDRAFGLASQLLYFHTDSFAALDIDSHAQSIVPGSGESYAGLPSQSWDRRADPEFMRITPYASGLYEPSHRPHGRGLGMSAPDSAQGCCRDFLFLTFHGIDYQPAHNHNV